MKTRCAWCLGTDLMTAYHDEEWGVPLHDDRKLFEFLVLDAFQAGLSWSTILNKRSNFRRTLDNFDAAKIARYTKCKTESLLADAGIVRNRLKVLAAISNAKAFLDINEEYGSFDDFIWQFVDRKPRQNKWKSLKQIPPKTKQSDVMSKALKGRGFKFVGSTICYAFMQAAGMVNDHVVGCFRHAEVGRMANSGE